MADASVECLHEGKLKRKYPAGKWLNCSAKLLLNPKARELKIENDWTWELSQYENAMASRQNSAEAMLVRAVNGDAANGNACFVCALKRDGDEVGVWVMETTKEWFVNDQIL